jgi:iduronate 2-sulfatase
LIGWLVVAANVAFCDANVKNVLFIVSDDLKASVLGCYGDQVCLTPNIDKLASQGTVFNRAYCQGVACGPSRRSFMHSRYKDSRGVNLGEHFKNNGYYSARVGKIFHMGIPNCVVDGSNGSDVASAWTERFNSLGLEANTPGDYASLSQNVFTDDIKGRVTGLTDARMFLSVSAKGDGSDQPDYKTADKVIELLRETRDKPFFLAAGFVRPHFPFVAPKKHFALYPWQDMVLPESVENDIDDIPKPGRPKFMNSNNPIGKYPANQKRMWAAYYASVTFMDEQLGRVMAELDELGLRESTAIVFLSDHGYHLGEHSFWQKHNLHEEATRVPLIISIPGMKPGKSNSFAELVDLYPTLAELVGLEIPEAVQGTSLVPVLKDANASVKTGALSFQNGTALREKNVAYMRYKDGSEELYDMVKDPKQFTNQAKNPEYATKLKGLRSRLDARLKETGLTVAAKKPRKRKK